MDINPQKNSLLVSIVMPAFNESEGIADFLTEIIDEFQGVDFQIIVVDDCSEDLTLAEIKKISEAGAPVKSIKNTENSGHGPTTVTALKAGLDSGASLIMSVDGDGQFFGADMRKLFNSIRDSEFELIEGARIERHDPLYRRFTSLATRILVRLKSGKWPQDANTPLRVYRARTLFALLLSVPDECLTPNLFISALVRKKEIPIGVCEVKSISRRGSISEGSTWRNRFRNLPSKRFLKFIRDSSLGWIKFEI